MDETTAWLWAAGNVVIGILMSGMGLAENPMTGSGGRSVFGWLLIVGGGAFFIGGVVQVVHCVRSRKTSRDAHDQA